MVKDVRSVDLEVLPNGNLKIKLRKGVRKLIVNEEIKTIWDLMEGVICNSSWELVTAEEVGGLTDCQFILADETTRDDHGNLTDVGNVYWHERYQIEDALEVLKDQGYIILLKAD